MGITSFTLNGLGVDAAANGVNGTVPRRQEPVKGTSQDLSPDTDNSWFGRRNHQFLPNQEAIAVGERVFFEDRIFRNAEAGGNTRKRVAFPYDVTLLLTRSRDRWRASGCGDNR